MSFTITTYKLKHELIACLGLTLNTNAVVRRVGVGWGEEADRMKIAALEWHLRVTQKKSAVKDKTDSFTQQRWYSEPSL